MAEVSSRKNITVYYRIQRQSLPIGIGVKPHIFWASVNSSSCFVSLHLCAPLLSPAQFFSILNCFTFLILSYMSSILLASFHFYKSLGLTWLVRHFSIHIVHYSFVHVNLPLHTRYRSFISYQHLICATIKSWIVYLYWRMVINSLIWIYIPIIRIPNMEWMTTNHILCFDPGTYK